MGFAAAWGPRPGYRAAEVRRAGPAPGAVRRRRSEQVSGSERALGWRRRLLDLQVKLPPVLPAKWAPQRGGAGAVPRCGSHWAHTAGAAPRCVSLTRRGTRSTCVWRERFLCQLLPSRNNRRGRDCRLEARAPRLQNWGVRLCVLSVQLPSSSRTKRNRPALEVVAFKQRSRRQGVVLVWSLIPTETRRNAPCLT